MTQLLNEYIKNKPFSKQLGFLMLPHMEALYGGQAGGGKQVLSKEKLQIWRVSCRLGKESGKLGAVSASFNQELVPMILNAIDVQVGDYLIGPNGQPTKVIKKSAPEYRKFYRITFDDGSFLDTSDDHNWLVYDLSKRAPGEKERGNHKSVVTTTWLLNQDLKYRDGQRFAIPLLSSPVEVPNPEKPLIDPWLLGYWLGNGCSQGSTLTCHSDDAEEIHSYAQEALGIELACKEYDPKAQRSKILLRGFIQQLREIGWFCEKRKTDIKNYYVFSKDKIPNLNWKLWSSEDRLRFIQGVFDSDGHANARGDWEFDNTNLSLVQLVREVLQSLALKPSSIKDKKVRPNEQPSYRIFGTTELPLFRLKRKATKLNLSPKRKKQYRRYIQSVEYIGIEEGVCFSVDNPEHLYVAGRDYIVTHNSDILLSIALQYVHIPGYAAIIFRKTLTDLKQPSALIDRSFKWLAGTNAKWQGDEHCWYFPTITPDGKPGHPSRIQFGYIGESNAYHRYQSAEYQVCVFDELTQHEEFNYTYMFSRLRKLVCPKHRLDDKGSPIYVDNCGWCQMYKSLPIKMRGATNPGGVGHEWVRNRFMIEPQDGRDPYTIPEDDTTVVWVGRHPERPFLQASYRDNPYIDQKAYAKALDQLPPVERARLKYGNWAVNPDSRFKRAWARYYSIRGDYFVLGKGGVGRPIDWKSLQRIFITVDPAASLRSGMAEVTKGKDPSYTVISVWGLTQDFHLLWLDMDRFQDEIPEVVKRIQIMYKKWRPQYVKIEANGAGRGVFQYCQVYGLNVRPITKQADKVVNSTTAQVKMEHGRIWLPEHAHWLKAAEDEVFNWTGDGSQKDDIVDTLSDACNDILWEAGDDREGTSSQEYQVFSDGPLYIKM